MSAAIGFACGTIFAGAIGALAYYLLLSWRRQTLALAWIAHCPDYRDETQAIAAALLEEELQVWMLERGSEKTVTRLIVAILGDL